MVRFGGSLPAREELTALGLTEGEIAAAALVADRVGEVARRVTEDRGFAAELATDPGAALAGLGVAVPSTASAASPFAAGVGRRFEIRSDTLGEPAGGEPAPESAVSGLVAHAIRAARASQASWRAFVADPDPVVRSAASTFPWAERGVPVGSTAAASVVQEVCARFRRVLGLSAAPGSSDQGPAKGSGVDVEIAVLPDLQVAAAIRVQSVRIPASPRQA